jgi:hypothetical protein
MAPTEAVLAILVILLVLVVLQQVGALGGGCAPRRDGMQGAPRSGHRLPPWLDAPEEALGAGPLQSLYPPGSIPLGP